ncbi:MAG: SPOR domain-containing protein [Spirochaetia bacterium]
MYAGWLDTHPGASGGARVFASYFRLEQDFPLLLRACGKYTTTARGTQDAAKQFAAIAQLYDLSGRIEEARDAYLLAYAEGAPPATLISAFLLSLEMNDSATMTTCLAQLGGGGGSAELLLEAIAAVQSGDDAKAKAMLVGLADQTGDSSLAVRALWVLYEVSIARGDDGAQASARMKLSNRFPGAPETSIATRTPAADRQKTTSNVFLSPGPDLFSGYRLLQPEAVEAPSVPMAEPAPSPPPSNPVPKEQPSASPQVKYSVQAGSFLMKENADDLVVELAKRGFTPVVAHDTMQGKDRYRVFAGTGLDNDAAKTLLARLAQAGFSGFIVGE